MKVKSFEERRRSRLIVNCALLCVLGLSSLYAGCASSSGTTRSTQESASEKAKAAAKERGPRRDPDVRPVPVNPWPSDRNSDAYVFDDRRTGNGLWALAGAAVEAAQEARLKEEEEAAIQSARERLALRSLTATLVIADAPAGSSIYIDGRPPVLRGSVLTAGGDDSPNAALLGGLAVAAGRRHVRVEAYGFALFETLVECTEGDTSLVRWNAEALPFEIRSFTLSQNTWRPEFLRDGSLAGFFFTVETTAPGPLSLEIRDGKDRPVARLEKTSRRGNEVLHWNGCGDGGKPVAAGTYRARLEGFETSLEMTILPAVADSSPSASPSGLSGFYHAPDAGILEDARFELGGLSSVWVDSDSLPELLFNTSVRIPLGRSSRGELAWTLRGDIAQSSSGEDLSTVGGALAIKYRIVPGKGEGLRAALFGRFGFDYWTDEAAGGWPPPTDPFSSWSSGAFGGVVEYRKGQVRGSLSLEYAMSDLYPELMLEETVVSEYYWWTYVRGALALAVPLGQRNALDLSLSLALRSRQGSFIWPFAGPAHVAAECRFMSAGEVFFPSLLVVGAFENPNNWYLSGGAGLLFRF